MRPNISLRFLVVVTLVAATTVWIACNSTKTDAKSASADSGKIPVTTKSEDARKEFLQGQALADKLQLQDSVEHFDKAIALDPDFASAELARANSAATAHEFFEHLKKAVGLADKTSDGEKLLILANEAGANGDTTKQKEYLDQLVASYPNDERIQFIFGAYDFGQQDFAGAIEHLKKATGTAPDYSPSYNMLGYSYRQSGDYANAEQAFKKYIALIPNDPNPYDSYAELLLKMGRFDDSITQYRKALSIDPNFVGSHFGACADFLYMGKPAEAATELQKITDKARSDGERRTALFGLAVVAADAGKLDQAVSEISREYAIAEKANDQAAMSADLQAKGNILLEMGKYDAAKQEFEHSAKLVQESNLSQEIKDNANLVHHYNLGMIVSGKKDLKTAKAESAEFSKGAEASKNSVLVRQSHELAGIIALAEKNYDQAIAELSQANQQNPQNLYRMAQAYEGKGDKTKASDYYAQAAGFNSLPQLNYAFVRTKAQKMAESKKAS
jgi:tetratricopeptide (TPR) repeat protein